MAHIDYFFSTMSPFTYLAGKGLEEVAAKHGASVFYKPMDLMALFARTGGTPPAERHVSRQEYRLQELARNAVLQDVRINLKPAFLPVNTAPSSYAVIAAQAAGGGDVGALVQAFLRAVWAEERDIADSQVIRDCLSGSGFNPDLADSGLLMGAETYSANLEEAVKRGVFGSPFYVSDSDQRFWGHDRLDQLDAHLSGQF